MRFQILEIELKFKFFFVLLIFVQNFQFKFFVVVVVVVQHFRFEIKDKNVLRVKIIFFLEK